uniref:Tyrosinase_Cu-bd domain-containing protein n=1 Tax=Meloidogyne hapla TaxID=6305 RepID=A0A1I8AZD4_MELHA
MTEDSASDRPALKCFDQSCVCSYYGGKTNGSLNDCTLPNGQKVQKAIRKEIRMLTDEERHALFKGIRGMKDNVDYDYIAAIHKLAYEAGAAHMGAAFFIWHREYCKRFEILLRKYNTLLALAYWDTTLDSHLPTPADSILFTEEFFGTTNSEGYVVTGMFAPWETLEGKPYITRAVGQDGGMITDANIQWTLSQTKIENVMAYSMPSDGCPYEVDYNWFEFPHGKVHNFIGGDMSIVFPNRAANEVIFFFFHSFVDLVFELWRQARQTRNQRENDYPADLADCENTGHFKNATMTQFAPLRNIDGLSNKYTDNMYEYAPRPTCTATTECGSKYLFCDRSQDSPRCVSKVRPGGNCKGFSNEDVCYNSTCVNDVCVVLSTTSSMPTRAFTSTVKKEIVTTTAPKMTEKITTSAEKMEVKTTEKEPPTTKIPSTKMTENPTTTTEKIEFTTTSEKETSITTNFTTKIPAQPTTRKEKTQVTTITEKETTTSKTKITVKPTILTTKMTEKPITITEKTEEITTITETTEEATTEIPETTELIEEATTPEKTTTIEETDEVTTNEPAEDITTTTQITLEPTTTEKIKEKPTTIANIMEKTTTTETPEEDTTMEPIEPTTTETTKEYTTTTEEPPEEPTKTMIELPEEETTTATAKIPEKLITTTATKKVTNSISTIATRSKTKKPKKGKKKHKHHTKNYLTSTIIQKKPTVKTSTFKPTPIIAKITKTIGIPSTTKTQVHKTSKPTKPKKGKKNCKCKKTQNPSKNKYKDKTINPPKNKQEKKEDQGKNIKN